jgi:hypothetical protein
MRIQQLSEEASTAWGAAHKGYPVPRRDAGFANMARIALKKRPVAPRVNGFQNPCKSGLSRPLAAEGGGDAIVCHQAIDGLPTVSRFLPSIAWWQARRGKNAVDG